MKGSYYRHIKTSPNDLEDVWERVCLAIMPEQGAKLNPAGVRFLNRFLPDQYEPKPPPRSHQPNKLSKLELAYLDQNYPDLLVHTSAYLYAYLYYSFDSKHRRTIDHNSCKYSVFIPFEQPSSLYTRFYIFASDASAGQQIPMIEYGFIHRHTSTIKALGAPPVSFDQGVDRNKFSTFIDNLLFNQATLSKEYESYALSYGLMLLNDTNGIRLPCHNVSYQCAYEMVNEDVGDFRPDPLRYGLARQNNLSEVKLKRKPLSLTMLMAVLLWPVWVAGKFSEVERLDMLLKILAAEGHKSEYETGQEGTLRVRCLRMFSNHLSFQNGSIK
jgi:hypothetical protein